MAISSLAAGSYAAAQRLSPQKRDSQNLTTLATATQSAPQQDFGSLVRQSVDALGTQANATDQAIGRAVTGQADLVNIVTAVAESETAVQTLVSVRDKVIAAYEDVMRMTI